MTNRVFEFTVLFFSKRVTPKKYCVVLKRYLDDFQALYLRNNEQHEWKGKLNVCE